METARRIPCTAFFPVRAVGARRNRWVSSSAVSSAERSGGKTGMSRPRTTPAMAACTPEARNSSHSSAPKTMYTEARRTRALWTA